MKTKTNVRPLAAAAALCAACTATASQDVALPALDGSPEIVVITVGVSVEEHALLTATYQGAAVDVVPIHPETEEVILQVTACYAAGQPGAPLGLEARDYDGNAIPLTLVADKGADGPVRRVFGRALPEPLVARRPSAPADADGDVPAGPDFAVAPNPFNPSMRISFRGELGEFAMVNVYDLRGRLVNGLYSGPVRTRETELTWLGRDGDGRLLPSGVYFVHLFVGGREEVKKVLLAK